MKKLLLTNEGKFHKVYQSRLNKYRIRKEFVSLVEIGMLSFAVLFCIVIFLIFINKSSTQGHFLREARDTLNNVEFSYDSIKPQIIKLKKLPESNTNIQLGSNVEIINID